MFENERYITDEHFREITAELERYPDKPVIMIIHTPPAVSGLLTVPEVHVRASNAYLNQDHGYQKWVDVTKDYRQGQSCIKAGRDAGFLMTKYVPHLMMRRADFASK